jgi:O-antigen/teichoic acid export membrane protein
MTLLNPAILFAFAIRALSAGLAYVLFVIAARNTSQTDYGAFAIFFTVVSACATVSPLGQQSVAFKYLPAMFQQRDRRLRIILLKSLLISCFGALCFWGPAVIVILFSLGRDGIVLAALSLPVVFISTGSEYLFVAYRALGSIYSSIFAKELLWRLVFVSFLISAILFGYEINSSKLALFLLLASASTLLFLGIGVALQLNGFPRPTPEDGYLISSKEAAIYFGITAVNTGLTHLDTLLLGLTIFKSDIPVYFSAQRVTQILLFVSFSFSMVKAPDISVAFHHRVFKEIRDLSRNVGRNAGLLVFLTCVGLFAFAGEILSLFNPAFASGANILRILCIGPLVLTLGGLHSWIPTICGLELEYLISRIAVMLIFLFIKVTVVLYGDIFMFALVSSAELCAITAVGVLLVKVRLGIWII